MNWLLELKRPFIWLARFRYRCGYGVHSPFAFSLITDVIYEKRAYYAYDFLEKKAHSLQAAGVWKGTRKVNRLLFRLVNRVQPVSIVEVGRVSMASYYMQQAKPSAFYCLVKEASQLEPTVLALPKGREEIPSLYRGQEDLLVCEENKVEKNGAAVQQIGFLYLNEEERPELMQQAFEAFIPYVGRQSVFVVQGIGYSQSMKALWKQWQADDRVGITFDLYDVGLIFFDQTKIKQSYVVNF